MKISLTKQCDVYNYSKPYIIAEIGANHNGDMDLAKKMILSAKQCGCDAVKFQSWTPTSLLSKEEYNNNQVYTDSPKKHFGSLKEMVEKYYLTSDQHMELKEFCDDIKVDFCSTPFSETEASMLNSLNISYFKLASMDINNHRLLRHVANFDKPVLLSTGMATLSEIETAVRTVEDAGNHKIILLHCISIYPPKYEDINLNNITMLQNTFGYPVGFSDHTIGFSIPLAAVTLGACIIEKHFTLDKTLPGWDHEISADRDEMEIICSEAKNISESLGSHSRIVSEAEQEKKQKFRRSIVTTRSLQEGYILREEDICFKRPGTGIQIEELKYVVGRKLNKNLGNDEIINWSDLQ